MSNPIPDRSETDHDVLIDTITGNLLRAGVLLSALVLLVGGGVYLWRHGTQPPPDRHRFHPMAESYSRPADIFRAAAHGEGRSVIQIGVMLLIATPLLRVLFTAVAFAFRRDFMYVLIPLLVLGVLIFGIWTGQTE